jgi:hypothetical protein
LKTSNNVERRSNAKVYNFEVKQNHNYFVGEQGLLVHNACKRGPKTDINAPHNKTIRETGANVTDGNIIAGGGIKPERLIDTPGGFKGGRRPDILVQRPDGSQYGINVGRQTTSGSPVTREVKAIQDLEGAGIPMHFVPYNH